MKPALGITVASVIAFSAFLTSPAMAGEVEIIDATARPDGAAWTISVTLRHEDTGWEHYADLWQVRSVDGAVLGERVLLHPHENEQPFTRSLSGVALPETAERVIIRARDTVHGLSDQEFVLELPE